MNEIYYAKLKYIILNKIHFLRKMISLDIIKKNLNEYEQKKQLCKKCRNENGNNYNKYYFPKENCEYFWIKNIIKIFEIVLCKCIIIMQFPIS